MAYRFGERRQTVMFPASVEAYVAADDPVRAYDAFVEQLDFGDLGIEVDSGQVGPPAYDPKAMLKLLVYGYSYGIRSSRKLERASHHNVSFIRLMGGLRRSWPSVRRQIVQRRGPILRFTCLRNCTTRGP